MMHGMDRVEFYVSDELFLNWLEAALSPPEFKDAALLPVDTLKILYPEVAASGPHGLLLRQIADETAPLLPTSQVDWWDAIDNERATRHTAPKMMQDARSARYTTHDALFFEYLNRGLNTWFIQALGEERPHTHAHYALMFVAEVVSQLPFLQLNKLKMEDWVNACLTKAGLYPVYFKPLEWIPSTWRVSAVAYRGRRNI